MRISRRQIALAVATAAILGLTACGGGATSPGDDSAPATAPLLRIGSLQEPQSWDPGQANEGHLAPLFQSVYDTLIKRKPDGSLTPMLATEWAFSDDGLTFTLKLRDNIKFTDGETFDSDAVKANIEHFQKANGPMGSALDAISAVETPDAVTAVLRLSAPDPSLPYVLTSAGGYMGSPDALTADSIATMPVGSGPYQLDASNTVTGSKIAMVRNDDYWGERLPYDKVEFQIMTDDTARLNALRSGQLDAAMFNRAASAIEAENAGLHSDPYSTGWMGLLIFDREGQKIPELADVRVREALALAIDTKSILDVVEQGRGELTSQTFGPRTTGYLNQLDSAYKYDPERARQLLKEAGTEDLTITFPISNTFDPTIYDSILQNWEDVGIKVERHQWGPGEAMPSMLRGDFPIGLMKLNQRDSWQHIRFLGTPDAPWNPYHMETPDLDKLIRIAQYGDETERDQAAKNINQYFIDQVWFVPMYRPFNHFYWNDAVSVQNQIDQAVPSLYNYSPAGN
ncbi:ABC transporter substrate-binding protein [Saccharomonospora sp. NPDC046836]|uniref:ABC transporter substrate-binding protein n=1 Tax=Saccharomonospora sp. NPDC046836 TaxID=3156921 RepID=UPI0033E40978